MATAAERQARSRQRRRKAGDVRLTMIVPSHVRDRLARLADRDRVTQSAMLAKLVEAGLDRAAAETRADTAVRNLEWAMIALARVGELLTVARTSRP